MKMNKNIRKLLAAGLAAVMLTGCGQAAGSAASTQDTVPAADTASTTAGSAATEAGSTDADTSAQAATTTAAAAASSGNAAADSTTAGTADAGQADADSTGSAAASDKAGSDGVTIRVGSLKGPTTMGLVNLMNDADNGEADQDYEFTMASQPDEIVASVASGDLDIALIPANLASVLYNKTNGEVSVIDINTLGVLYCVTGDSSISSIKDLAGKTVLTTGQGATPEYALEYLLDQNGITDCKLEFHSEATEIAALLKEDPTKIAVLPQPFVTSACAQNDQLKPVFSLTDAWDEVSGGKSRLLTGVTVVRSEFLTANPDAVDAFIADQEASVKAINDDPQAGGELVAKYGIIEKAPIAAKAIPNCNIVCITGEEMKTALSGYLDVLAGQNPKAVGGKVPGDDFYYLGK